MCSKESIFTDGDVAVEGLAIYFDFITHSDENISPLMLDPSFDEQTAVRELRTGFAMVTVTSVFAVIVMGHTKSLPGFVLIASLLRFWDVDCRGSARRYVCHPYPHLSRPRRNVR